MEAVFKTATRNAQQLTKDTSQEEVTHMLASMATTKEELSKVLFLQIFISMTCKTYCLTSHCYGLNGLSGL